MRKASLIVSASAFCLAALTSARSTEIQIISDTITAQSCVFHSESVDPAPCTSFHVFANADTSEFERGATIGGRQVAYRIDGRDESTLAFAFPTLFFEGLERSLRVRGFAQLRDGAPDWEITDGHCTGDGAGNLTCAALGGGETVVLKLKGLES